MEKIDYDIFVEGGYREDERYGVSSYIIIEASTGQEFKSGHIVCHDSTSMRIFIEGAVDAMKKTPFGSSIRFITDTQYLVNIVNHKWRIKANEDLWERFENVARIGSHKCCAEWRGIRQKDVILQRCWRECSDVAGFDFVKSFMETYQKKHPSPHGEGRS